MRAPLISLRRARLRQAARAQDRITQLNELLRRSGTREVLPAIGNLALLERPLNAAASNRPFNDSLAFAPMSVRPFERPQILGVQYAEPDRLDEITAATMGISTNAVVITAPMLSGSLRSPRATAPILNRLTTADRAWLHLQ